jgi:hypothetical protein
MSIRKCSWTTAKGEQKEAWVVDYADTAGKRRLKTFQRKKDADGWWRKAGNEIDEGTHTPDSDSITVEEAAKLWLESCSDLERATVVAYKQHVDLHIVPLIGGTKLSQLSAPMVRSFEDRLRRDRSVAMQSGIGLFRKFRRLEIGAQRLGNAPRFGLRSAGGRKSNATPPRACFDRKTAYLRERRISLVSSHYCFGRISKMRTRVLPSTAFRADI